MNQEQRKNLYEIAQSMLAKSYAPYSGFRVGAALLGSNGAIYTGVNVENASFGATICAERSAAACAVSDGCREFEAIAIVSSGGTAMPCGICRQVLSEFSPQIEVITGDVPSELAVFRLNELLPYAFDPSAVPEKQDEYPENFH